MAVTVLNSKTLKSGYKISYSEVGDPHGRPLFFFHGWPGSSAQGDVLAPAARKLGLRVITVNRPGILQSDFIPNRRLADWGELIADLADQLGLEKFSVLAISGGAPYALACAWAIPERLDQIVIVSGAPLLSITSEKKQLNIIYRFLIAIRDRSPWFLILLLNLVRLLLPLKIHRTLYRLMAKNMPARDKLALIDHNFLNSICQSLEDHLGSGAKVLIADGNIYTQEPGFDPGTINKKIVFWHGRKDRNIALAAAQKMASLVPNSELIITEEDGHYSLAFLENYKILKRMLADADLQ